MENGKVAVENGTKVSQKLEREPPYDPTIPFWYLSKRTEKSFSKRHLPSHAHCSVAYNSQEVETIPMPAMGEYIKTR